jgi:hypothetical protein
MSDEDKQRFIAAVTGADGKVNSKAAAALIAAAASGTAAVTAASVCMPKYLSRCPYWCGVGDKTAFQGRKCNLA